MNLTIVIPVFNETESLPELLRMIEDAKSKEVTFLIVDNGSTKSEVGLILNKKSQYWSSSRSDTNLGFGGGILFGIAKSSTEFVGWMPGNLKVDPREVLQVLSKQVLEKGCLLKAKRTGRNLSASTKTALAGFVLSTLLKENMLDSGGTPTICHRDFVLGLANPPKDYVFESFILYQARKHRLSVSRINVTYGQRVFGQSHWQRGLKSEFSLMKKMWDSSRSWKILPK